MNLYNLFQELNGRRQMLGMSYACLSDRAGISVPTVVRILSGKHLTAGIDKVNAIAEALDMGGLKPIRTPSCEKSREKQAHQKAKEIVGALQATSGLEGQALNPRDLKEMENQTFHELLAGPRKRLWG